MGLIPTTRSAERGLLRMTTKELERNMSDFGKNHVEGFYNSGYKATMAQGIVAKGDSIMSLSRSLINNADAARRVGALGRSR